MTIINVGTLNTKGSCAPLAVRELIDKHNIAVMGLQEVDVNAERSGSRNIAHEIAGRHTHYAYAPTMRYGHLRAATSPSDTSYKAPAKNTKGDAHYGVALVSAHPFMRREKIFLGPDVQNYWSIPDRYAQREHEPRSAVFGTIESNGAEIWSMSSHLAYTSDRNQSSAVRKAQLAKLTAYIATRIPPQAPFIGFIDANATPENPDMRNLLSHFQKAGNDFTHPVGDGKTPKHQIDYIFYRNLDLLQVETLRCPHWDHVVQIASFKVPTRSAWLPGMSTGFQPVEGLRAGD